MHRVFIPFAAAFAVLGPALADYRCDGEPCSDLKIAADGCTVTNSGQQSVELRLLPDGSWLQAHPKSRPMIVIFIPAGADYHMKDNPGCLPEKNLEHAHAVYGTAPKPTPASTPLTCTGEACGAITLREYDDCLWLESSSAQPIDVQVVLKSGTTIQVALEGADLSQATNRETRPDPAVKAECRSVLKSWGLIESAGAQDSAAAAEIAPKVPRCKKLLAAESRPPGSYHYSIYSVLSDREYAVFRAKIQSGEMCVARADVASYVAIPGKEP